MAENEERQQAGPTRAQAALSAGERRSAACYNQDYSDPAEGSMLDAAQYGLGYGCYSDPELWTYVAVTYDTWSANQLGEHLLELDTDNNLATGCDGYDWAAFAAWSAGSSSLHGSMFRQPSCDSATWTITSALGVSKAAGDSIGLAFDNSQIGSPTTFHWRGTLHGDSADPTFDHLPNTGDHLASGFATPACTTASLAGYYVESDDPRLATSIRSAGGTGVHRGNGVTSFAGDPAVIGQALRKHDKRLIVRRDSVRKLASVPNDPSLATQWNLSTVRAQQGWEISTGSPSVVVAVIDSGVDASHPELAGQLLAGYDAVNASALPPGNSDVEGHGTSVAGVIAAKTDNGTGLASLGWQTRVMPIRASDASGASYVSAEIRALRYAADHGARVINLSLGSCLYSQGEADAVTYAQSKGALVVASAGNDSYRGSPRSYPAALAGVVGVGATAYDGSSAFYSNTGDYIDITAPGGSGDNTDPHGIPVLASGGGYRFVDGTSFSAPTVAAAAALAWAVNPALTATEVQDALTSTATDLGAAGRDDVYGWGMLDTGRLLTAVKGATASPAPSPTASPTANPSSSPTASPTVSPTASSADVQPSVTWSQSVISSGERVSVSYRGAPGQTLNVFSKTQPATDYSLIGRVTLDSSGFGTTSHAPNKNTRIMARTDRGLASDQPLLQVRSLASFSAKRVGARTFTFSGRVYPAREGRIVSLVRNGAFIGQMWCNADGIYSITRTLGAGTYNFNVHTKDDTYNLGTTSRTVSVRIY